MRYWLSVFLVSLAVANLALTQKAAAIDGVPTLEELAQKTPDVSAEQEPVAEQEYNENVNPAELNADDILAEIKNKEAQAAENQPEVLSPQGLQSENPVAEQSAEDILGARDESGEESVDETIEEVQLEVFEPEFMNSLMKCQPDTADNEGRILKIVGIIEDKCHLEYGNYVLDLPPTILNNIHSFDDLQTVIKNSDFTKYNYTPNYTYEGVIYALDACAKQEEYMGIEEDEKLVDAVVTRGLNAEYKDGICTIYLQNELDLDGKYFDYGVVCRLPQSEIDELEPYFKDIVAKYAAPDASDAEQPKEAQDADIALMYYLQKNGFCKQNKPVIK